MTLHAALNADLTSLTDGQPAQPGDRLASVRRRAGRLRRQRAASGVAAALALAVPAAVVTLQPHRAAPPSYAGVTTWPDRSPAEHRGVGYGALASWQIVHPGTTDRVAWLYRGLVSSSGRQDLYVAAWRTASTVVISSAETSKVDERGYNQADGLARGGWAFYSVDTLKAPPVLGLYIGTIGETQQFETSLFALAAPSARRLHWRSPGLPYAVLDGGGPTNRSGELSSSDGVFLNDVGPLAGPVLLDVPGGGTQPFGFGGQQASLAQPPAPDVPAGFVSSTGGAGATDATTFAAPLYATFNNQRTATVTAVRCYGGGTLRLSFGTRALGSAACDGLTHTFTSRPAMSRDALTLAGDRVQSYRFTSGTIPRP